MSDPTAPAVYNPSTQLLPPYQIIKDEAHLLSLLPSPGDKVVMDLETTTFEPQTGQIAGIAIRHSTARFYLPLRHIDAKVALSEAAIEAFLNAIEKCLLINHNIKYDLKWIRYHLKRLLKPYSDTMVLAHLHDSNQKLALKGEDGLAVKYLGQPRHREGFEDIVPPGSTIADISVEVAAKYAVGDVDDTWDLFHVLEARQSWTGHFLHQLEIDLIYRLVDCELKGIKIDKARWDELTEKFSKDVQKQRDNLAGSLGVEVNPDSPAQVKAAFQRLGIELNKTGIEGDVSVSQKSLKHNKNKTVKEYLEYKQAQKVYSSFLKGFEKFVLFDEPSQEHRVYVKYMTVHVSTGRMSTSSPNMQNLPKKGTHIRSMFVARPGHYLIEADYAQVELRVLASEAGAKVWLEAFEKGIDLHSKMGSVMTGRTVEDIKADEEFRRYCKTLNFGVVYGMNEWGLAQQLDIEVEEAKELIFKFFQAVPEIEAYIAHMKRLAVSAGFVCTKFGRVRWIPEARSSDWKTRNFGLRTSVNTAIQGTAADINKIGLIRCCKKLIPMGIWPLANVHDSNLFEVPNKYSPEEVAPLIKSAMVFDIDGYCKMDVDVKVGPNWEELKPPVKKTTVSIDDQSAGLKKQIFDCTKCTCRAEARAPVPPEGPTTAKIMILGRNPGEQENAVGTPFYKDAPGGDELEKWLQILGIKREELWVTNAVKCHTKWDRQPTVAERKACKGWLEAEIKLIKPKVIIALGNDAIRQLTGDETITMTTASGTVMEKDGYKIFLLYHPGSTIRNNVIKDQVINRDLPKLKEVIAAL